MLLAIYITLVFLGFMLLAAGIYYGSSKTKMSGNDQMGWNIEEQAKMGPALVYLMLSAILFSIVALQSMDITDSSCLNQQVNITTSGNTTSYLVDCQDTAYKLDYLGALFGGMVIFDIAMMLIYVINKST